MESLQGAEVDGKVRGGSLQHVPEDGVDGDAAGEDLEKHEVHVRGEAAEELDPGRLVVFGVEGEREDDPHRREDHHYPREGVELPAGPVLDANRDLINYRIIECHMAFYQLITLMAPFHRSPV